MKRDFYVHSITLSIFHHSRVHPYVIVATVVTQFDLWYEWFRVRTEVKYK